MMITRRAWIRDPARSFAAACGVAALAAAGLAWAAQSDDLTTANTGRAAYNQPFAFLTDDALAKFRAGSAIFRQPWLMEQSAENPRFGGFGPLANRLSCIGCHIGNGRGETSEGVDDVMRSTLVRLSISGTGLHCAPLAEPVYGDQLQPIGISGILGEGGASIRWSEVEQQLPDGTKVSLRRPELVLSHLHYGSFAANTMTSIRITPAIFGLGLLAAVPDRALMALADPNDANGDGVRGRVNRVWNTESGRLEIGRFGLKANQPTLRQQTAGALNGDIGITSPVFKDQNCSEMQQACRDAPSSGYAEIDDGDFETLVSYLEMIAPPARRAGGAEAKRGEALFEQIGCAACHMPTLMTGKGDRIPQFSNREIHPYTDILLHDMGDGLADGRPDFAASGRDWRTPPLWGIGLAPVVLAKPNYLHDGRARDLNEAILWHGGEGQRARDAYAKLIEEDRRAVIAFLNSF